MVRGPACTGPSRRDVLLAGGLAPFGLGLTDLFAPRAVASSAASAKSAILLFMATSR